MGQADVRHDEVTDRLTFHVGGEERLFERARRCGQPSELVVASAELHRRNVQRRLREQNLSKEAFVFDDPKGVSRKLLAAAGESSNAIDRIDRLALIRSVLADAADRESHSISLPPGMRSHAPDHVEQIRTEVEAITNYHPERVTAWRRTAGDLYAPIDAEATELLTLACDVERELREQTPKAISEIDLVRRATQTLVATNGTAWTDAFPSLERVTLFGLSSLSAPHADLLHALVATTPVTVHVHFRKATGAYLQTRAAALFDIDTPGEVIFE